MDRFIEVEEAPPGALRLGGYGILAGCVDGERIINTGVFQCERERRDHVIKVKNIHDAVNNRNGSQYQPPAFPESFPGGKMEDKKENAY